MSEFTEGFKWFFRIIGENFRYKNVNPNFTLPNNEDLKIMSFNIRRDCAPDGEYNWKHRKSHIIEMIKDTNPDIICMQEVMPHMAKYLVSEIGNCYNHVGLESFTNRELSKSWCFLGEGVITFFKKDRFDLIYSDYMKLFDDRAINVRRALITILTDKQGNPYSIFNAHFCSMDRTCRKNSFDKIYKYINDNGILNPFIAGDFNCETTWVNNGIELFLKNFHYNIPDKKGSINSYKDSDYNITIDFIFSEMHPITVDVIRKDYGIKYISDHWPVLCTY